MTYHAASGSSAEDLFIELFSETFGAEQAGYLYSQYHFYDIYQKCPPAYPVYIKRELLGTETLIP